MNFEATDLGAQPVHSGSVRQPKKPRPAVTGLFITVNQNLSFNAVDAAVAGEELREATRAIFSLEEMPDYIDFLEDKRYSVPQTFDSPFIEDVKPSFVLEYSERGALRIPHMHVTLVITHRTYIRLNANDLRAKYLERLPHLKNIHIDFQLIKGAQSIEEYMRKNLNNGQELPGPSLAGLP